VRQQFAQSADRVAKRAAALTTATAERPPLPYRKSTLPPADEPQVAQRPTIRE
jgi:hypothetical protein